MNKNEVIQEIKAVGVIRVVRASSEEEAIQVVEAIKAGGLPILEITMTVPRAVQVIETLARRYGKEAIVGAGTVLDAKAARACRSAGAQVVVSPALNLGTIRFCQGEGVAGIHRARTPTEI